LTPFLVVQSRLPIRAWSRLRDTASLLALKNDVKIIDFLGHSSFATASSK
jgi:hypothetical protein